MQSNARFNALDKLVMTVHSVKMPIGDGRIATKGVTSYQLLPLHMSTGLLENDLYLNFYSVNQVRRAIREYLIQLLFQKKSLEYYRLD